MSWIQGTVNSVHTKDKKTTISVLRTDGSKFWVKFPEEKSFAEGQELKPIPNVHKLDEQFKGMDMYEYRYEEARDISKPQFVPTDEEPKVDVPELAQAVDHMEPNDPYLELTYRALQFCIETEMLKGEKDELAQNAILVGGMCTLMSAAKQFKGIVIKEQNNI